MEKYNQLIKKAKTFFYLNQFENAQICLLNILKSFELNLVNKFNIYLLLADINKKLNNFKDANNYSLSCLEINPNNPKILNSIANNYSKMSRYEKAEEYYLKAISFNKDYEEAIINLAILFDNLGKKTDALNFYEKAIKINPNNLSVLFNMQKLEKKILDEKKVTSIKKYLNSGKQDFFNAASGYFLLAENEKKRKNIVNEIFF